MVTFTDDSVTPAIFSALQMYTPLSLGVTPLIDNDSLFDVTM